MNSRLEQFIRDHRDEFDADEPGKNTLEKILLQVEKDQARQTLPDRSGKTILGRIRSNFAELNVAGRSAAAAIFLLAVAAIWYFSRNTAHHDQPVIAASKPAVADSDSRFAAKPKQHLSGNNPPAPGTAVTDKDSRTGYDEEYTEEMYHYAKLVEIKHRELKTIEKDEPLLYRQFAGDVSKLDSVYHTLEKQLPENPNREQLLEAMIQNLQLQMGLLNHQLEIIKKINHTKKTAYEKAYKTA
jgi:hypothetical protein